MVRDADEPRASLTEALVENLQREDLGALEEAAAFRQLIDDFGLTHDEVAEAVGRSRSAVSNTVRLLQLPAPVHRLLEQGNLTAGHARALLGLEDAAYAAHIASRAAEEGWSVRQVEDAVRLGPDPTAVRHRSRGRYAPPPSSSSRPGCPSTSAPRSTSSTPPRAAGWSSGTVRLDDLERIYRNLLA